MRFDWYQGTIYEDEKAVLAGLSEHFDEVRFDRDALAKQYRYGSGVTLRNTSTGEQCEVFFGGHNGKEGTHFISRSDNAIIVSDAVRRLWPDSHHVTRADPCQDLYGPELFQTIRKKTLRIARKHNIKAPFEDGDAIDNLSGATQYLGAKTSDYRARVYQKGLQIVQNALSGARGAQFDEKAILDQIKVSLDGVVYVDPRHLVRVEAQLRPPTKHGKLVLASAKPEEAFGFSPWLVDLAQDVFQLQVTKLDVRGQKVSDLEHKTKWLLKHYGATLSELIDAYGEEGMGKFLAHELSKQRLLKR